MVFAIRRPTPPLNGKISRHFFTPLFFFCNWILHIWNGFYTSKISLLSPLIIGSKLTFISSSGRWLPTIEPCSKSSQLLYIHNINRQTWDLHDCNRLMVSCGQLQPSPIIVNPIPPSRPPALQWTCRNIRGSFRKLWEVDGNHGNILENKILMKPLEIEGWTIVLRHLHPTNASGKIQSIKMLQLSILKMKLNL